MHPTWYSAVCKVNLIMYYLRGLSWKRFFESERRQKISDQKAGLFEVRRGTLLPGWISWPMSTRANWQRPDTQNVGRRKAWGEGWRLVIGWLEPRFWASLPQTDLLGDTGKSLPSLSRDSLVHQAGLIPARLSGTGGTDKGSGGLGADFNMLCCTT